MNLVPLRIRRLPQAADLPLPAYRTAASAGLDLCAAVPAQEPVTIDAHERHLIGTGLLIELPEGTEAQIRPRSGLALEHGLTVLNAPGTIDADYPDEICVLLINLGQEAFIVEPGDRIAQLVVNLVGRLPLTPISPELSSARTGGFGSTGI